MESKPLRLLVLIKFTVDLNQLRENGARPLGEPNLSFVELERAPRRINNFDENAIEAAVRLKEIHGGRVVAISLVESRPPQDLLLRALAMGVDAFYLQRDESAVQEDAHASATALAGAIQEVTAQEGLGHFDLIICGEASVDEYNGQVGPRIAEAQGIPCITYVTRLEVRHRSVLAERTTEDDVQSVEVDLPVLVSVGMETNQPRLPSVLQIMGAGRKPVIELSAPTRKPSQRLKRLEVFAQPSARKRIVVQAAGMDETARKLLALLGSEGALKF